MIEIAVAVVIVALGVGFSANERMDAIRETDELATNFQVPADRYPVARVRRDKDVPIPCDENNCGKPAL